MLHGKRQGFCNELPYSPPPKHWKAKAKTPESHEDKCRLWLDKLIKTVRIPYNFERYFQITFLHCTLISWNVAQPYSRISPTVQFWKQPSQFPFLNNLSLELDHGLNGWPLKVKFTLGNSFSRVILKSQGYFTQELRWVTWLISLV